MSLFNKSHLIILLKIALIIICVSLAIITQKPQIAVLYIATGKYIVFWDDFYQSMEKNFLPDYQKTYFVFTDDTTKKFPKNVVRIYQKQLPWPRVTLKRYHFFQKIISQLKAYDYIYFLNANALILKRMNEEIIPLEQEGLMVSRHPYSYSETPDQFGYDRNPKSNAYIPYGEGKYYFLGGFNGGTQKAFIQFINEMVKWTDDDLKKGIIPVWHDESYLNRYMINYMKNKNPRIMDHYCTFEWYYNISDPFILILDKNHFGGHDYLRGIKK